MAREGLARDRAFWVRMCKDGTLVEWREALRDLLTHNAESAMRACAVLYGMQTAPEQRQRASMVRNHEGFTACDAGVMGVIADVILHGGVRGHELTKGDYWYLHEHLPKYWRQLMEEIKRQVAEEEAYRTMFGDYGDDPFVRDDGATWPYGPFGGLSDLAEHFEALNMDREGQERVFGKSEDDGPDQRQMAFDFGELH